MNNTISTFLDTETTELGGHVFIIAHTEKFGCWSWQLTEFFISSTQHIIDMSTAKTLNLSISISRSV